MRHEWDVDTTLVRCYLEILFGKKAAWACFFSGSFFILDIFQAIVLKYIRIILWGVC